MSSASSPYRFIKASRPSAHVLLLSLDRPGEALNAFNEPFWRELGLAFSNADDDEQVRAVVLASSIEKAFTVGLDLQDQDLADPTTLDPARKALQLRQHILEFQDCITAISRCRVPVIAAAHGFTLGLGIDILCASDIRIAAEGTTFSIREVAIGMAADIGTLQRAPKLVGNDSLLRELALTGRFFDVATAKELGLIGRAIPGGRAGVLAEAIKIADEIAALSPIGVIGTKHLLDHARDHTIAEGLEHVATWNSVMLQGTDLGIAMTNFAGRRKGGKPKGFDPLPSKLKAKL